MEGLPEYCLDYKLNKESSFYKTPVYGYMFDTDPIKNELAQIKTVRTEFEKQLWSGAIQDYQSVYNNMLEKLKNAGIDKVIQEAQKQADAFMAGK